MKNILINHEFDSLNLGVMLSIYESNGRNKLSFMCIPIQIQECFLLMRKKRKTN